MTSHLLPSNATVEEIALSLAIARDLEPEQVRLVWQPENCPIEMLPWLAWAFHVDDWDDGWDEQVKRRIVHDSIELHRKKGTPWAVKQALLNIGYPVRLIERTGTPYIFNLEVGLSAGADIEQCYRDAVRYADMGKNERSHIGNISMRSESQGNIYISTCAISGIRSELYPSVPREMEVGNLIRLGVVTHCHVHTEIFPA